ncbi:MAG: hypothetical protein ABI647_04410 [Gemmatimonadota bacterium]
MTKKSRPKGRYWILFWLLLFLGAAGALVARQGAALRVAGELRTLEADRQALEARRAELDQRIRSATSLPVLGPKVQRSLGLGNPTDSQTSWIVIPPLKTPDRTP